MSERKLLIFGNGLGMSIDKDHFLLETSLKKSWDALTHEEKSALYGCLPKHKCDDNETRPPTCENELDALHSISTACSFLNSFRVSESHEYLNQRGKLLPAVSRKYIYRVAEGLFSSDKSLKKNAPDFETALVKFIKETNSHVATLNYDKLLYSSFVANKLCTDFEGCLVDGFTSKKGFSTDNLQRLHGKKFGYYLHLHGSPLFLTCASQGKILKLKSEDVSNVLDNYAEYSENHIVLANIKHKPQIIASSILLSSYWDALSFCMSEVNEIILFGYSGVDVHLNKMIRQFFDGKKAKIVEWNGSVIGREIFWRSEFKNITIEFIPLTKITDFKSW